MNTNFPSPLLQNNIPADFPTPSRAVSMPALTDNQTDDLKVRDYY